MKRHFLLSTVSDLEVSIATCTSSTTSAGCPGRTSTSRCPASWMIAAGSFFCARYSTERTLPLSVRSTQYAAAILVPCTSRVAHAKSAAWKSTFIVTSLAESRLKTVSSLPRKSARPPCGRWRCGSLLTETGHAEEHAPHFLAKTHSAGNCVHEV